MDAELLELRTYLLLPKEKRQASPYHGRFAAFLHTTQRLFSLRLAAENRFSRNRWLAIREDGALPLTWAEVDAILSPKTRRPQAGLETRLARDMPPVLSRIFDDIRKLLRRSRQLVNVSQVRQLDSGCLRWLIRQPGRCVAEKAGPRQQVMGVIREDDYNTLENRVLKDFLLRVRTLTDCWLDEHCAPEFQDEPSVKAVAHLNSLCVRGLSLEALEHVSSLTDLPAPNFALQQDNRYARLWRAYRLVIRWSRTLEDLWGKREQLERELEDFTHLAGQLACNHCLSELWVRSPESREVSYFEAPLCCVEPSPKTESATPRIAPPPGLRVIDLMGDRLSDLLLLPDERHPNAKPRLIDFERPYTDFPPEEEVSHHDRALRMCHLWQQKADTPTTRELLALYFVQLHTRIGGDRWMILVPDDWSAEWQEAVLSAASQAFGGSRGNVRLLWRSIACVIGGGDPGKTGKIICRRADGRHTSATFRYSSKDGKPIRRSYLLHPENYTAQPIDSERPLLSLFSPCWATEQDDTAYEAERGARWVDVDLRNGRIPYYEEQEGLYLLIQTMSEELRFLELLPPNPESPAGQEVLGTTNNDTRLLKGNDSLKLWVQITDKKGGDPCAPLKSYVAQFRKAATQNETLQLRASANPGQGVVCLRFTIPSSGQTELLRLEKLRQLTQREICPTFADAPASFGFIEEHIERSFPPTSSRVYATEEQWTSLGTQQYYSASTWIPRFLNGDNLPIDSAITYNPADRFPLHQSLPEGVSPLERLSRNNVFGNVPGHRLPPKLTEADANRFFQRLAKELHRYSRGSTEWYDYIRIIAWTYQSDATVFDLAKKQCRELLRVATINNGRGIKPQAFTLCANLLTREADWKMCLQCVQEALRSHRSFTNIWEYLRLFYNLMQFHPDFLEKTKLYQESAKLHEITRCLIALYISIGTSYTQDTSKCQGYLLKCFLYLLRCRRYDGKTFLGEADQANKTLRDELLQALRDTWVVATKEALRDTVIAYINGKGTIDGLPTT